MPFNSNSNAYGVNENPHMANTYPTGANPHSSHDIYGHPLSTAMSPMETLPGLHAPAPSPHRMQMRDNMHWAPAQHSNISPGNWPAHATQTPPQLGSEARASALHIGDSFESYGQHHNSLPLGESAQNHGLSFGEYEQNNIGVPRGLHEQYGQQHNGIPPIGYPQHYNNVLFSETGQQCYSIPSENDPRYRHDAFMGFPQPHTGVSYGPYGQNSTSLLSGAYGQPPQSVNGFGHETSAPYPNAPAPMLAAPNPLISSGHMVPSYSSYNTPLDDDLRAADCHCDLLESDDASEQQEIPQSNSRPQPDLADAASDSTVTSASPAGQPNSTNRSRPCRCGPGCQCPFCEQHPYNVNSWNQAYDLSQLLLQQNPTPSSRPQSSYRANIAASNALDGSTNVLEDGPTNVLEDGPTNVLEDGPTNVLEDGPTNVLEDGQVTNQASNPDPSQQQQRGMPDGYNIVEYAFNGHGIPTCPRGTETCRCVQSCTCHRCINHIGHIDELSNED
ncbi:MAG: hypothetical protein Q9214_000053 [Letrouitia sp. 1 TL-2023]